MDERIFWLSAFLIAYTWIGYYAILALILKAKEGGSQNTGGRSDEFTPPVTTIISVYNEAGKIDQRLQNLLAVDYPRDKHEIIIASDGSTDGTVDAARQFVSAQVRVLDFEKNRGRATVHNDAVKQASGHIIIFSDADTEFDRNFVRVIAQQFAQQDVGCASGNMTYKTKGTAIAESEGLYFRLEKMLREKESSLGLLATGSGPCMAVRKQLWKKLNRTDDCDFTTPLDVILQGFKVKYEPRAIAYDIPPASIRGEYKARVRMTAKNFSGTLRRWGLRGLFEHPLVSWALYSHKIFRWLTPFFLAAALISNIMLLRTRPIYQVTAAVQLAFYLFAAIGFIGERRKRTIPLASTVFSFSVAMAGMGVGVMKGVVGLAPATYKTED